MATVDVDIIAPYSGVLAAQVNWLGPKVGGHSALFLHSLNEDGEPLQSCKGCALIIAQFIKTKQTFST